MGKKVPAGSTVVKYKGDYDFGGLYRLVFHWMQERKYWVQEKRYKDKIDNPLGNEVEVDLIGYKKETSFTKLHMSVSFHNWDYKEKEGVLHGEKKKFTGGRIIITITTYVEFDWQGIFTGSKLKEQMGKLYMWLMKKEFNLKNIDQQEYEALLLSHEVKKFLKMETDPYIHQL